jgi:hypothetical protein
VVTVVASVSFRDIYIKGTPKTYPIQASTGSARAEPIDPMRTVRTERIEVRGFSMCSKEIIEQGNIGREADEINKGLVVSTPET